MSDSHDPPTKIRKTRRAAVSYPRRSCLPNASMTNEPEDEVDNGDQDDQATEQDPGETAQADAELDSEMGVVEEIYCENFMCHRKMRVALCPHINFITGENGSGKSAIIAAIQICLGASARVTHRGKSIKNLIRHGHEGNALVRITLRNDAKGSDAFRPEQFGKRIMVERLIRRDGSAEYRLKDERGVLVSKLKSDLEAMLDHLNIQTENPCAILDQENAKLFLKGNPADKYKFFLQSTDLYGMRTTYSKIGEEMRMISESTLKQEQAKLATLTAAMKEAEKQWTEAQSIGKLEADVEQLKKVLAWSLVCEKETQAAQVATKIQHKKQEEDQAVAEHTAAKQQVETLELRQQHLNDELEQVSKRVEDMAQQQRGLKTSIREAQRPLYTCKMQLKHLVPTKARAVQRLHRLKSDLEAKKQKHEDLLRSRIRHSETIRARLESMQQELMSSEQELHDAKLCRQAQPQELEDLDTRHASCLRQCRDTEGEVGRTQQQLRSLLAIRSRQTQEPTRLAAFGSKTPQLQRLIHENLHRFAAPPIGPLGLYVKLPERFLHFAVAIEQALGGALRSYLVADGSDKALLDALKCQVRCPPNQNNIIIAKRTGQRYGGLRLAAGSLGSHAICNVLEVTNDEVFNALIDVCSMESKLLYDDRESAEKDVLSRSSDSFQMARCVSEVLLPNGDKFLVRAGNLAYIASKGRRRSSLICQDVDGDIRELEQKLSYLRGELETLQREETQLRHEREAQRHQVKQQSTRIDHLSRRYNQRCTELRNLEEELADDLQQETLDTSVLEEEIQEVQVELQGFHAREQELQMALASLHPDVEVPSRELEKLEALEKQLAAEQLDCQARVYDSYQQLEARKLEELMLQQGIEVVRKRLTQWEQELAVFHQDCDRLSQSAKQQHGDRADVTHPHRFYEKRLAAVQRRVDRERSRFQGMDLAELQADMEAKQRKVASKRANLSKVRGNVKRIGGMLEERQREWQLYRDRIARHTSATFDKLMQKSNFVGKLKFRHKDQQLGLAVMQNEQGASQVTDMKELSGGERSYTQASLLLALGESAECPFRVMDEFDVFMDSVNRDMTIQLLVDAAKKASKQQFIF
ncbi:hypothetical protein BBJ28_00017697, partial [Nothophytophthora sp. Chile5]